MVFFSTHHTHTISLLQTVFALNWKRRHDSISSASRKRQSKKNKSKSMEMMLLLLLLATFQSCMRKWYKFKHLNIERNCKRRLEKQKKRSKFHWDAFEFDAKATLCITQMNKLLEMLAFYCRGMSHSWIGFRFEKIRSKSLIAQKIMSNANHEDCCQFYYFVYAKLSHSNDKMISFTAFLDAPAVRSLAASSQCQ